MKKSYRVALLSAICLVTVVAFTANHLLSAEAGNEKKRKTTDLAAARKAVGGTTVVINEMDADQAGVDAAEFVELLSTPATSLNGYVLVFYNGSNDTSYAAYDLDGLTTDANGFVVLGNTGVAGVDVVFASDGLQNGQDAVALYLGDASNFPNGTAVTAANLVDAIVYDTSDADDPTLLATLLNPGAAQVQVDENGAGTGTTSSIKRCGSATRDGRVFSLGTPTPSAANTGCPNGPVDFNGDGRTDFSVVRDVIGGSPIAASAASVNRRRMSGRERIMAKAAGQPGRFQGLGGNQLQWLTQFNSFPATGGVATVDFGNSLADQPLAADFDGDGSDDVTVWRSGAFEGDQSYFYSINSSDFTFRGVPFGTQNDTPYVVGDYDGDDIDDPAVFRCPSEGVGQCYFYYLGSLNNPGGAFTFVPFGQGTIGTFLPLRGDYNGDGKHDFVLQGADPGDPNSGIFYVYLNGTSEFSSYQWGQLNDLLVSGDFDGDGKADITVTRVINDALWWFVLESDGGVQSVQWGSGPLLDLEAPGDYNGDGRDDFAVYRPNANDATFLIQPSGGGTAFGVNWGNPFDVPVSYFFVQ